IRTNVVFGCDVRPDLPEPSLGTLRPQVKTEEIVLVFDAGAWDVTDVVTEVRRNLHIRQSHIPQIHLVATTEAARAGSAQALCDGTGRVREIPVGVIVPSEPEGGINSV